MNRILVIRGGAIGDFVLTLPAIGLLRERFPSAHLDILGYKHIAALAEKRFYADGVRSIESASLSRFFSKGAELPPDLREYFGSFDLIISYLYDPDRVFADNVSRCGNARFIEGPSKLDHRAHAAIQLARPLEAIGLRLVNPAARLFPSKPDRAAVSRFRIENSAIVLHPGSGSETKNWQIQNWRRLGDSLLSSGQKLVVIGGEADGYRIWALKEAWSGWPVEFVENLPLPHLAALLENKLFLGHDSGIAHIAAADGARCVLLFGPTDPAVWAPANEAVTVVSAPDGKLNRLELETVAATVYELMRIGINT